MVSCSFEALWINDGRRPLRHSIARLAVTASFIALVALTSTAQEQARNEPALSGPSPVVLYPDDRWLHLADIERRLQELENESWELLDAGDVEGAQLTAIRRTRLAKESYGENDSRTMRAVYGEASFRKAVGLSTAEREVLLQGRAADKEGQKLTRMNKHTLAKSSFESAIEKYAGVLGPKDSICIWCMSRLAYCEMSMGQFNESRRSTSTILSFYRQVYPPDDPNIPFVLHNLALVEYHLKDFEAAEKHWRHALALAEPWLRYRWSAEESSLYVHIQYFLAAMKNDMGRHNEAEMHANEASHAAAILGNSQAGFFVKSQVELGRSYSAQGKNQLADFAFARAVGTMQKVKLELPKNPPPEDVVKYVLTHYSAHLRRTNRMAEAERCDQLAGDVSATASDDKSKDVRNVRKVTERPRTGEKYLEVK